MQSKRELLQDFGYEDSIVFENPDYDDAIVGVTTDGNVIYDYDFITGFYQNDRMEYFISRCDRRWLGLG